MCLTKELKHTVCQHTDSHTEPCLSARGSPFFLLAFLACLSNCTPKMQSVAQYDLCHDCRRYWAAHEVSEWQATKSYMSYRRAHGYDGPLAPRFVLLAGGEEEDEEEGKGQGRARGGGNCGAKGQFPSSSSSSSSAAARVGVQGVQNISLLMYGEADSGRRASEASMRTQWPSSQDLSNERVPRAQLQAQRGMGKGKEAVRDQSRGGRAGMKGVVLLSEDEEGPPTWI